MSSPVILAGVFALGFIAGVIVDDLADRPFGKENRTMKERLHRASIRARAWARLMQRKATRDGVRSRFDVVMPWLVILAMAASGVSSLQLVRAGNDLDKLGSCVADYNQRFAEAYKARLDASAQVNEALDRIVVTVYSADREGFRKAVANYVTNRQKVKNAQATNPYPPLPTTYCGPVVTK
ncbi:hypothetical protein [Intrasporangium flavum]|uniref:hypothetical protein n=1 Tax=Intrasporangium flavum TaxID=1428657 RepID=UPI00096E33A3|nr:hypothetical protein [Intrasporangium flavum]